MDVKKHLQNARLLTELLDTQWNILGIRFGLDPVFDLIPGAQFFPTLLSGYLVWIALRANLSSGIVVGMIGRIVLDLLLGTIPWLGVILDLVYKVNVKNLEVLEKHIGNEPLEGKVIKE